MFRNIGIISQVRMTSTRLPGKVLKTVKDQPLLKYHCDRARLSQLPLVIATTKNVTDDPIEEFCKKEKIEFYRGSENHVLSRYYEAAKKFDFDVIVRITSDCPLIDGNLIGVSVKDFIAQNDPNLYLSNTLERTFPRGFDFEIFSFQQLETAFQNADKAYEVEHVTPFINQNRSGNVRVQQITNSPSLGDFRITVDEDDDFKMIKCLIEDFNCDQLNYSQICQVLLDHPELKKINQHVEQKKI